MKLLIRPTNAEPRPFERYTSPLRATARANLQNFLISNLDLHRLASCSSAKAWPCWWMLRVCHWDHGSHGKEPQKVCTRLCAHYVMENLHCLLVSNAQMIFRTWYQVNSKILPNLTRHGFISCTELNQGSVSCPGW